MVRRARQWQTDTKQVDLNLIPLPMGYMLGQLPFATHITFSDVIVKVVLEHQRYVWSGEMVKAHIQHNKGVTVSL